MSRSHAIKAIINGRPISATVPSERTLSEFLRGDLGLTGTKESCALEICGSCTVIVDDRPVSACTMLAVDIDGGCVTTVEGLKAPGPDGPLHPLQRAFVDRGAMQCGYCTAGFLMSAVALLSRCPDPRDEDIRHALHGNICRCTGYEPIIEAVHDAARVLSEGA